MSELREHLELRQRAFGKNLPTDFMLEYGRDYDIGPNTYRGDRDEEQQCFMNATCLALRDSTLTYVEGYVAVYGILINHAWCVDDDGVVIDTTLQPNTDGRIGGYFGVPLLTEYVRRAVKLNNLYGVLDYFHANKTAPKLYELGLTIGQVWLLNQPERKTRRRKKEAA